MWTMTQWAMFPYKDRMEKIVKARGYRPIAWSFAKPLFKAGGKQPSEEELVEMANLAIAGDVPPLPKETSEQRKTRRKRKNGASSDSNR